MSSTKYYALLLLAGNALADSGDFAAGFGLESDSDDGISTILLGGVGLGENTWLSGGLAKSSVDLATGDDLESDFADIELDHYFDPVGIRVGVAYWRGSDILESQDWRASLYWRNEKVMLAGEYEFRDFDLTTPGTDLSPSRQIMFDASGIGVAARFNLTENTSLSLSGKKYDYSVPFRPIENRDVVDLISASRLSLINSLVDNRVSVSLGIDQGQKRWELQISNSENIVIQTRTKSVTLRFLMPMSERADIEFGIGRDDSDLYGEVTFLSLHVFFYGGS